MIRCLLIFVCPHKASTWCHSSESFRECHCEFIESFFGFSSLVERISTWKVATTEKTWYCRNPSWLGILKIASPQTCPPLPSNKKNQRTSSRSFQLQSMWRAKPFSWDHRRLPFHPDHHIEQPSTGSPSAAVMPPMEQSPLIKATVTPPLPTVPQAEDDFFRDEAHLVGAAWHNTRTLAGYSYGI